MITSYFFNATTLHGNISIEAKTLIRSKASRVYQRRYVREEIAQQLFDLRRVYTGGKTGGRLPSPASLGIGILSTAIRFSVINEVSYHDMLTLIGSKTEERG